MRLSYSLVSLWLQGKSDEAIQCYLRLKKDYVSKAMEDGKRIHEDVASFVDEFHTLPDFLPKFPLIAPKCEEKIVVPFSDMFDISGVFDILDSPTLFELKTGVQDSIDWSTTFQIPVYFMIAQIAKIPIDKAILIHYNQHNKTNDWCLIWNNQTAVKRAVNLIDSVGPEIYKFFDEQGLI